MRFVGVVVPTLFQRANFLRLALESVKQAGNAYVILMGPEVGKNSSDFAGLFDHALDEPAEGNLSSKLTFAINSFPSHIDLVTWIGDDDLLTRGSLDLLEAKFRADDNLALVYGACRYIDAQGNELGQNRSGAWAMHLAKFGPFLAPQPGSLFRRKEFEMLGGLDPMLELAFDFDLFLAIGKLGRVEYVSSDLACFRWHDDSLSVRQRRRSVKEAALVRLKHASRAERPFVRMLNPLIQLATLLAGTLFTLRVKFRAKSRDAVSSRDT